jgi:hypothetical protein
MGRNYLKGKAGDRFNVKMAAIGFNFLRVLAWLLAWLKDFLREIVTAIVQALGKPTADCTVSAQAKAIQRYRTHRNGRFLTDDYLA